MLVIGGDAKSLIEFFSLAPVVGTVKDFLAPICWEVKISTTMV